MEFNGGMKKTIKYTVIGFITTGMLALLATVGQNGLRSMVQEQAKLAVEDTVGDNSNRIDKLKEIVEQNIKEDNAAHPRIETILAELDSLTKQINETNKRLDRIEKNIDKLTETIIEYIQNK